MEGRGGGGGRGEGRKRERDQSSCFPKVIFSQFFLKLIFHVTMSLTSASK